MFAMYIPGKPLVLRVDSANIFVCFSEALKLWSTTGFLVQNKEEESLVGLCSISLCNTATPSTFPQQSWSCECGAGAEDWETCRLLSLLLVSLRTPAHPYATGWQRGLWVLSGSPLDAGRLPAAGPLCLPCAVSFLPPSVLLGAGPGAGAAAR